MMGPSPVRCLASGKISAMKVSGLGTVTAKTTCRDDPARRYSNEAERSSVISHGGLM
jgi:hypothetical protein